MTQVETFFKLNTQSITFFYGNSGAEVHKAFKTCRFNQA